MSDLIIRDAGVGDAEDLLNIYSWYVDSTAVTFEYDPPTVEEFRNRIACYTEKYPYLCAVRDGEIIGFAFAHAFRDRPAYDYAVETSIYLRRDVRHTGVGAQLYTALEDALKKMGVINLYACIAVPNEADPYLSFDSPRFHEKQGYKTCGTFYNCGNKFGRWYSMVWMEKIIGVFTSNADPIIPYPAVKERSLS